MDWKVNIVKIDERKDNIQYALLAYSFFEYPLASSGNTEKYNELQWKSAKVTQITMNYDELDRSTY